MATSSLLPPGNDDFEYDGGDVGRDRMETVTSLTIDNEMSDDDEFGVVLRQGEDPLRRRGGLVHAKSSFMEEQVCLFAGHGIVFHRSLFRRLL